ncbi:MFS general substrate transporter [Sistotremastrum suecicum HHB10207 ss-3]|uniref:MFS general substrate transporter n=1 Tax=Sistotremastrum suecicum HHB10207 ss-3 TaxID=1314776 RepID=A0A166EZ60_9AGAM|nr:MFS general substrate transporter [Sistotremastrum suecicum HHB10207 ss-3]
MAPSSPDPDVDAATLLSFLRLTIAHIGHTIVSTSMPTIIASLHASEAQYSWPGIAYLLSQTALQPLYPRLSDIAGRKTVLFWSITFFLLGSLLCGAAQSMVWLALARALAGAGGGGIVNSVWVIATEIVPIQDRPKWSIALSVTWSASAVAGPLIGGLFSGEHVRLLSWRWAFYINIPIGVLASLIMAFSLPSLAAKDCPDCVAKRLPSPKPVLTPRQIWLLVLRWFDFIGLALIMGGTVCVIIGFSFAASVGWSAPTTCSLLSVGGALLIAAGFYEAYTTRDALIPPMLFKQRTTLAVFVASYMHNFAFTSGTYFLALYYQAVHGSTPLMAGILILPYSLGSSLASLPPACYISARGPARACRSRKEVMIFGMGISCLGFGLMILLDQNSGSALQELVPLVAGIGIGMLFHTPFGILTSSMPEEELASTTGAFFLVRFIGTTTGLSVAQAIFTSRLVRALPAGFTLQSSGSSSLDLQGLVGISDEKLRNEVLGAVSSAIQWIWIICTPCLALGCMVGSFPNSERG